jgi:hypothetical protein
LRKQPLQKPERSKKKFTTKIAAFKQIVNTVTSYEIVIAEKLTQLPIPDMADSIWADIAAQLDAPLPGEDGHEPPQPEPGRGLPGKGFFFAAVTVVVITAVWYYAGKKSGVKENAQPQQTAPVLVSDDTAGAGKPITAPGEKQLPPMQALSPEKDAAITFDTTSGLTRQTAPAAGIDLPTGKPDSAVINNSNSIKPVLDSAAMRPPPPKPKGVKGISDDDYKIKGEKKDSV